MVGMQHCSVFLRQQQGGRASVGLRDDPQPVVRGDVIGRQQTAAVSERSSVRLLILLAQVTPIPRNVAQHKRQGCQLQCFEHVECTGGDQHGAQGEQGGALLFVTRACGGLTRRRGHGKAPEKKGKGEGKGEKERSAAMRSAPPTPRPGAIRHHTTHHRRDDTATAVPRVLSWRQPRATVGLRREENQAGGWENTTWEYRREISILAFYLAANSRHANHQFECNHYITTPNQRDKKQLYQYPTSSQPFAPQTSIALLIWRYRYLYHLI